MPEVFKKDNHVYCVRHVMENFLSEAAKLGIRWNASKNLLKELFSRFAYATTKVEYEGVLDELRKYKRELAECIEKNEPKQWAQSKFGKEWWWMLNINSMES